MSTGLKANPDGSAAIQVGGTDVITLTSGGAATFVTSPTTVQAGTAAAPSITFSGDTNTGIYSPGADTIAFTEGGVESMRINSSGQVGIGTTSPGYPLHVSSSGNNTKARFTNGTTTLDLYCGGTEVYTGTANSATAWAYDNSNTYIAGFVNSSEKIRITSSGNVGIGTTSPAAKLSVSGTATFGTGTWPTATVGLSDSRAGVLSSNENGIFLVCNTSGTVAANNGGEIRFGATATTSTANATQCAVGGFKENATSGNFAGYLAFKTSDSGGTMSERARITSGGEFLVGTANNDNTAAAGGRIYSNGSIASTRTETTNATFSNSVYSTGASAYRFYVGMAGTVYATSTTITAISDQRLKENIQDIDAGLDKIMALKPRKFDWKEGKGKDTKGDRGWIAQEFEQVFPEMIDTWLDPAPEGEEPYKAVNADLIPVLVKAIQEQQAMIDELKAKVAALEGA